MRPLSLSIFPVTAASVRTLVVSWKDAADTNESVASEALVIPRRILSNSIKAFPSSERILFFSATADSSACSPKIKSESPGSVISTFLSICLKITSMCLSDISTPWSL